MKTDRTFGSAWFEPWKPSDRLSMPISAALPVMERPNYYYILNNNAFDCFIRMVSCGRSNIRVWRLKESSLRSAAIPLGEHHVQEFTDICWDFEPTVMAEIRRKATDERKV